MAVSAMMCGGVVAILVGTVYVTGASADRPDKRPFISLRELPRAPEMYMDKTGELMRAGLPEKYGREEWAAVALTHEFHQHMGIYTVLGAKMAVRAREILKAPMRAVRVTAETGRKQPVSCAVDGMQVGLGSTLGQDLIAVPDSAAPKVAATFEHKGRQIRLVLSDDCAASIADLIRQAREKHGDLTPEYFEAVENAAYRVWSEFDRKTVFAVEEKS